MRSIQLRLSVLIVALEALGLAILLGFWVFEFATEGANDTLSAIALLGIFLAATIWLAVISHGLFNRKRWAHSAAIFIQIILAVVGLASFTGEFGSLFFGWLILTPAIIGLISMLSSKMKDEFSQE